VPLLPILEEGHGTKVSNNNIFNDNNNNISSSRQLALVLTSTLYQWPIEGLWKIKNVLNFLLFLGDCP